MSLRKDAFAIDEWYHCYTRGVEKRRVFQSRADYERYVQLLYLCNSTRTIHRSDIARKHNDFFSIPRDETLVSIGAYCLMPNHPHLLLKEVRNGGISKFMQKLGTAYTMYFNIRYERTGGLFVKPFRSKHINNDAYFQRVIQYIHFNPAELTEPLWKQGVVRNMDKLEVFLREYVYSSFQDHERNRRPQSVVVGNDVFELAAPTKFGKMLNEARQYYEELVDEEPTVKATP